MKTILFYFTSLFNAFNVTAQQPQLFWGRSGDKQGICPEERVLTIQTGTYEGGTAIKKTPLCSSWNSTWNPQITC